MTPKSPSGLFRELEPPEGGLAELRGRIEARQLRRIWWRRAAISAAAAGLLIAVTLMSVRPTVPSEPATPPESVALTRMRLGLKAVEGPAVQGRNETAVLRVSEDENVAFYLVATR